MKQFCYCSLILLVFLCFRCTKCEAQLIFTKTGGASAIGDYFPAVEAGLYRPVTTAADADGNLYIADKWANIVRRIDASTGIITTVAGRGLPSDFQGDGGPAIKAVFALPGSVAVDIDGNLYIADQENLRIRKVDVTTGIITTIAGNGTKGFSGDGGSATLASMGQPYCLTVDRHSNVYFVDIENNRVRKITATDGIINTIAGNGTRAYSGDGGLAIAASFDGVSGVAADSTGNLYLADGSHRIRKVDATTGIVTTVAGNGLTDFAGDGGPASAASFGLSGPLDGNPEVALDVKGNLYIQDAFNSRVRKVDALTGIITTVAGNGTLGYSGEGGPATSAGLGGLGGIATDKQGNLFITDYNNSQIRKVAASTGMISTVAGNGKSYYLGDGKKGSDVAIFPINFGMDREGNLFVVSRDIIRRIDALTGVVTTVAGTDVQAGIDRDSIDALSAILNSPEGVCVDGKGNLFIVNQRQVRKVDAVTGMITTIVGKASYDPSAPFPQDGALAADVAFTELGCITIDSAGNIYLSDGSCRCVRKVDAMTNILTTVAGDKSGIAGTSGDGGPATEALLYQPGYVRFDKKGDLYIVDGYVNRIRKVDVVTGIITTAVGSGQKGYVGDGGPAAQASLNTPMGICFDESDNMYIVDWGNNVVRKVDAETGIINTIAGNGTTGFAGDSGPAVAASFNSPFDIAVDKGGKIYIADYENQRVRYICPATALTAATTASVSSVGVDQNNQTVFQDNCTLLAKLTANGVRPVAGRIADSVWVEPTVPTSNGQPYVQRHYGITPLFNAATATGTLTLYFTQTDFTAYNAAPNHGLDLPIDAEDAANNKTNVHIKKRSGTSRDGSGLFDAYSGVTTDIIPTSVAWDNGLNAWAVTFEVSGFSGFFVTSVSSTLPVTVVSFAAHLHNSDGVLTWTTAGGPQVVAYEILRSADGINFFAVGRVPAVNLPINEYTYVDKNITSLPSAVLYYRLKTVEEDGRYGYSNIVLINLTEKEQAMLLFPNPVKSFATLLVNSLHNESLDYQLLDANGRVILSKSVMVVKGNNAILIPVDKILSGFYTVLIRKKDTVRQLSFIKQ